MYTTVTLTGTHYSQKCPKVNESHIHGVAEEPERRCGCIPATTAAEPPASLVVINTEQRQRELNLVPSPDSSDHVRVAESTQNRAHADPVEPFVAAEGNDDGFHGGRRGR